MKKSASMLCVVSCLFAFWGCDKKEPATHSGPTPAPQSTAVSPAKPDAAAAPGHHGGDVIELGESTVEGMKIKASRDMGEIKAGGDAPIDIWIDGGLGGASAVRFWIGTQDASGSVKAKADVENNHWHTHAEVPDPLPPGSMLWVEIESEKSVKKTIVQFNLRL